MYSDNYEQHQHEQQPEGSESPENNAVSTESFSSLGL